MAAKVIWVSRLAAEEMLFHANYVNWCGPRQMFSNPPDANERWWQFKTLTFDLGKLIAPQLEAAKALLLEE